VFTVYVIHGDCGRVYKGVTSDIEKRMKDHRAGGTKTTSTMQNLKIVYTESYKSFEEARNREKYLKTGAGRRFLKGILPM